MVGLCSAGDASVAGVALSHGLNANLVHRWIRLARRGEAAESMAPRPIALLPVRLDDPPSHRDVALPVPAIEIRIGQITIFVAAGASTEQIRAIVAALQ